ncbi:MAG TPA: hypothetical protein VFV33_17060, partial [Gemmatimonadaceae bacterium]|nr:hypothetical protein [Gemmatimonadaceae bacterium]
MKSLRFLRTLSTFAAVCGLASGPAHADEVFTTLDVPGAFHTRPFVIPPNGDVAGLYTDADRIVHGFVFDGATFTTIDVPAAVGTNVVGMNPQGDLVGWYQSEPIPGLVRGYLLSGGEWTWIDVPGASRTAASGINARGDIVG